MEEQLRNSQNQVAKLMQDITDLESQKQFQEEMRKEFEGFVKKNILHKIEQQY